MTKSLLGIMLGLTFACSVSAQPTTPTSIGKAKTLPSMTEVLVEDAVVTAESTLIPGSVFVEAKGKFSGVRVVTSEPLQLGQRIKFTGFFQRVDGEWQVVGTQITDTAPGQPLGPVGLSNRSLAANPGQLLQSGGLDTSGLLVRVWGKLTDGPENGVFYIDDGSRLSDGVSGYNGIRVHLPEGYNYAIPSAPIVLATGIVRTEKHTLENGGLVNGQYYPPGAIVYVPCVWVRNLDDVTPRPEVMPSINVPLGPTEISWDPRFCSDPNVLELQILRDDYSITETPVRATRDPWIIGTGHLNLANLYGWDLAPFVFSYYKLDSNPASTYSIATASVPHEPYGTTHTYFVRAVCKSTGTSGIKYSYTTASNLIMMTMIEPVRCIDIIAPSYDPAYGVTELLISELQDPTIDMFKWSTTPGADIYCLKVQPVIPGSAPSWQSEVIYAAGPTAKLTQSDRTRLTTILRNYPNIPMSWRVYCRHQADTNQAWFEGDANLFTIIPLPPSGP